MAALCSHHLSVYLNKGCIIPPERELKIILIHLPLSARHWSATPPCISELLLQGC